MLPKQVQKMKTTTKKGNKQTHQKLNIFPGIFSSAGVYIFFKMKPIFLCCFINLCQSKMEEMWTEYEEGKLKSFLVNRCQSVML